MKTRGELRAESVGRPVRVRSLALLLLKLHDSAAGAVRREPNERSPSLQLITSSPPEAPGARTQEAMSL